jgi:hypothetical protein
MAKSPLAQSRFCSAFGRSFVLTMSILIWFFIVPVPGLFVFIARDYRISVSFLTILLTVGCVVGIAIASVWIARLIEWFQREGTAGTGLRKHFERTYRAYRDALSQPGALSPLQISQTSALLTDVQTYLDQRSYAHAIAALLRADQRLANSLAASISSKQPRSSRGGTEDSLP